MDLPKWDETSPIDQPGISVPTPRGQTLPSWDETSPAGEEKYGTLPQLGLGALEAAAAGITANISKGLETQVLGINPEDIKGRAEQLGLAGPAIEFVAPFLLPEGSLLLKPLQGMGLLGKAVEKVGEKLGGKALARIAGHAATGATIGAVAGAADDWSEDKALDAEKIIGQAGWGAMFGGTIGTGIEALKAAPGTVSYLRNKLTDLVPTPDRELAKNNEKFNWFDAFKAEYHHGDVDKESHIKDLKNVTTELDNLGKEASKAKYEEAGNFHFDNALKNMPPEVADKNAEVLKKIVADSLGHEYVPPPEPLKPEPEIFTPKRSKIIEGKFAEEEPVKQPEYPEDLHDENVLELPTAREPKVKQPLSSEEQIADIKTRHDNEPWIDQALEKAQKENKPYIYDPKNIKGQKIPIPNYDYTGDTIGENRVMDSTYEDPFKWSDSQLESSKRWLERNTDKPVTINTSSDLIARDDYKELINKKSQINIYLGLENIETNKKVLPSNASNKRLVNAYEKLKADGYNVNLIEPSEADIRNVLKVREGTQVNRFLKKQEIDLSKESFRKEVQPEIKPKPKRVLTIKSDQEVKASLEKLDKKLNAASTAPEKYEALRRFATEFDENVYKSTLDESGRSNNRVVEDLRNKIRGTLLDAELWGHDATETYAELNKLHHEYLTNGKVFKKMFMKDLGNGPEISSKKIKTFFNQLPTEAGSDAAKVFDTHINNITEMAKYAEDYEAYKTKVASLQGRLDDIVANIDLQKIVAKLEQEKRLSAPTLGENIAWATATSLSKGLAAPAWLLHRYAFSRGKAIKLASDLNTGFNLAEKLASHADKFSDVMDKKIKTIFRSKED